MDIRTYRGKEISSVLNAIKKQHGEDAVIISAKEIAADVVEVRVGVSPAQGAAEKRAVSEGAVMTRLERNEPPVTRDLLIRNLLEDQGVAPQIISEIENFCEASLRAGIKPEDLLASALGEIFQIEHRLPFEQKFVALFGATGAGKTTTIAKMAARMRMAFDMKIALVSADNYRVGAGFHLQTYASLMNLSFRALDHKKPMDQQLTEVMEAFRDFDLVFIDTAGCSPRQGGKIEELRESFSMFPDIERLLLLSAPGNSRDLAASARAFEALGYRRVIITKLDESGYIGPVLNAAYSTGKPLSFLTTGQRVPEDIEPASARRLAWMLRRTMH